MKNLPNFNYEPWQRGCMEIQLENGQIDTGDIFHITPQKDVTIQELQEFIKKNKQENENVHISIDSEPSSKTTDYININQIPDEFLLEKISGGVVIYGKMSIYYAISTK